MLDSKQAFKQDWQKLAADRMWMLFESKLSSNLMFGFPVESGNFKVDRDVDRVTGISWSDV